jgi:hypothetical protein
MRSQDFSMTTPPNNQPQNTVSEDKALFIIRPKYIKEKKTILLQFDKGKPIEDLMDDAQKQATGLKKLNAQELANLNSFLDPDKVVAPGDQPHGPVP